MCSATGQSLKAETYLPPVEFGRHMLKGLSMQAQKQTRKNVRFHTDFDGLRTLVGET